MPGPLRHRRRRVERHGRAGRGGASCRAAWPLPASTLITSSSPVRGSRSNAQLALVVNTVLRARSSNASDCSVKRPFDFAAHETVVPCTDP